MTRRSPRRKPLPMRHRASLLVAASMVGTAALAVDDRVASPKPPPESSVLRPAGGVVMLDYQSIRIKGYAPIDLAGFHFLNRFEDWLYVGVGGHAPLFKGEYGGFMTFDGTVHAERQLVGNWSAAIGASLGGGGGGKTVEQSKIISGSGGFTKGYAQLGYRFDDVTLGLQYSKVRFTHSAINGSQLGFFFQTPFSYRAASYEYTGRVFAPDASHGASTPAERDQADVVIVGLDNIFQIRPKGTFPQTVNVVDTQYDHFISNRTYLLFGGSLGYHGIVTYNQVYGGVGYRLPVADRLNLYGQLAIGSGGYAPERIDTGSGLLIFPKLSAEFKLNDKVGVMLSGGYLNAPRGSSKNWTLGAALAYHLSPDGTGVASDVDAKPRPFSGLRFHLFQQTEFKVHSQGRTQDQVRMVTGQVDQLLGDHVYFPVQGSIGTNSYFGFPGYGELLAGLGVQNKYAPGDRFQAFAQLLVGPNVHGLIAKPSLGLNMSLSDRLAIYGQVAHTLSLDNIGLAPKAKPFRANSLGLGLTYRFSRPDR